MNLFGKHVSTEAVSYAVQSETYLKNSGKTKAAAEDATDKKSLLFFILGLFRSYFCKLRPQQGFVPEQFLV